MVYGIAIPTLPTLELGGPRKSQAKSFVQDCVGALQDLDLALQIEPDNPFALLGCAGFLWETPGDHPTF